MSKLIKLTDDTYAQLKEQATSGGRTLAGQIAYLLKGIPQDVKGIPDDDMVESAGTFTPKRSPCCNSSSPCKHWTWDVQTGDGYINSITGEVRKA